MKSKLIFIIVVYSFLYLLILPILSMYLHALTWDGGAKTLVEKGVFVFAFLIFPIRYNLINNAVVFFLLNWFTSVLIICVLSSIILKIREK